jgi:hypothetical protein
MGELATIALGIHAISMMVPKTKPTAVAKTSFGVFAIFISARLRCASVSRLRCARVCAVRGSPDPAHTLTALCAGLLTPHIR